MLTNHERRMIAAARNRRIVRLVDGQLVTLICYGGRRSRTRARVEAPDGETRWTIKAVDVIEVVEL